MNAEDLQAAERFFHEKIPLTRAMGVRVLDHPQGFAVEAPVGPNHNHLQTAFGGSVNAVATLAGYGMLWLELRETAHVIIASSSIRFLRPVRQIISAVCEPPTDSEWARFRNELRAKGKARIELKVEVIEEGQRAAEFTGTFVALTNNVA